MLTVIYYFLQVMLCSAVFILYYVLVLRNKKFHHYNRFYLLGAMLLSWVVPVIRIQFFTAAPEPTQMVQLLNVVADNNSYFETIAAANDYSINWDALGIAAYLTVSCFFLLLLLHALLKIYFLIARNPARYMNDIVLVFMKAKGAPFSFFKFIFWDRDVDINTEQSKKMLKHELAHVREKHSIDNILIQLNLLAGWFNPFFWIIKKEIQMIHEFIADKKAVEDGNAASLAEMLLAASYPQHYLTLTNPFLFSPIKRRLQMLTNNKNPRLSYLRRIIALPLLALVIILFSFRKKESVQNIPLDKKYIVVIDAGHGGTDKGAMSYDGTSYEKDIALEFAKAIREVNTNDNLEIILSRETDVLMTPLQKAVFVKQKNADLVISLHANVQLNTSKLKKDNMKSGIEIYIPKNLNAPNYKSSLLLANQINAAITPAAMIKPIGIKTRSSGIWILDANPSIPAVLIETGFLSNPSDKKLLTDAAYQKGFAQKILTGISYYLSSKQHKTDLPVTDVQLENIAGKESTLGFVSKKINQQAMQDCLDNFKKTDASQRNSLPNKSLPSIGIPALYPMPATGGNYSPDTTKPFFRIKSPNPSDFKNILYLLDGEEVTYETFQKLDVRTIQSVKVIKDTKLHPKYWDSGKEGMIEILTKKSQDNTSSDPADPSGIQAFYKRNPSVKSIYWKNNPLRMVLIHNDATEETYHLENESSKQRAIEKYGALPVPPPPPPPPPAKKGGSGVVFTAATEPPSFPGGATAWRKYLERNLKMNIPTEKGAPPGKYPVMLSFTVLKDGQLKNISPLNDPGYGTTEEAVRIIKKGPKWVPAKQNGKLVDYQMKQSVTFVISED